MIQVSRTEAKIYALSVGVDDPDVQPYSLCPDCRRTQICCRMDGQDEERQYLL